MSAFVTVKGLTCVFDVSKPWLNRVLERRGKAFLTAVSDVDFQVEERTTYALVGESGSGKSTIGRMAVTITKQAEAYLEALAKALEIPSTRYEQAEKSYKSLGDWLHRDASSVRNHDPDVFVQGSFRLGTVIRPLSDDEEYDVDCACSLRRLSKLDLSQHDLKNMQ